MPMRTPTPSVMRKAAAQVRRSVQLSIAAGVIPVPAVDLVVIQRVQLRLIRQLSTLFQVPYSIREAKAVLMQVPLVAGSNPSLAVQSAGSVSKWLPAYGLLIGTGSVASLAGFSTHQLGQLLLQHFTRGGCLTNFNLSSVETEIAEAPATTQKAPESVVLAETQAVAETEKEAPPPTIVPAQVMAETAETAPETEAPIVTEMKTVTEIAEEKPLTAEKTAFSVNAAPAMLSDSVAEIPPPPVSVATQAEQPVMANEETKPETVPLVTMPLTVEAVSVETLTVAVPETPEADALRREEANPVVDSVENVTQAENTENTTTAPPATVETVAPDNDKKPLCRKCLFWWLVLLLVGVGMGSWLVLQTPVSSLPSATLTEPAQSVSGSALGQ